MEHPSHPVESHWRTSLRNRIIQASSLLEVLLSGLVLIGLLFSVVPLIRWMPGLLFDGNEAEIRTFLERSLDIVIGIEFIKMLAKHSPGSSLEVLLYAIARHLVVGHDSAVENLLSVGAIALIFIVRKFFFVPAFGAHLPDGHPAPDLTPAQSGIPADAFLSRLKERAKAEVAEAISSGEAGVMMHGPTFMANPLACAVANASLDLLESQPMAGIVAHISQKLECGLAPARCLTDVVEDVRVLGSIGVVEVKHPVDVGRFQKECVARGVWIRPFGRMIYVMPPYVISDSQLDRLTSEMLKIITSGKWM